MRKFVVVLLFSGLIHGSMCTRIRFDQPFSEQLYRSNGGMSNEPMFKKEPMFQRESLMQGEQIVSQPGVLRNEQFYGNEQMPPQVIQNEEFLQMGPNDQVLRGEQMMRNEPLMQPILQREPIMRREQILRRESFLQSQPLIQNERIFQGPSIVREPFAFMLTQCPLLPEPQMAPQESYIHIPTALQPQILTHRIFCTKPMIKSQMFQPLIALPRIQRFVRKNVRGLSDSVHFHGGNPQFSPANGQLSPANAHGNQFPQVSPVPNSQFSSVSNVQFSPIPNPQFSSRDQFSQVPNNPDFNNFNNEPIQFPNFQNSPSAENTSEPNQTPPATVRNAPQMSNPLNLAQMSSIC